MKNGVTAPKGFLAGGIASGIKKNGKPDLGLLISEGHCQVSGVFTRNTMRAAPVIYTESLVSKSKALKGVLVNSGNANAGSGRQGEKIVIEEEKILKRQFGVSVPEFAICSTGSIGKLLPVDKISASLPQLVNNLSEEGGEAFAESILTTDKFIKQSAHALKSGGRNIFIGAAAKGAGMIHPNMATMLCFVTTDLEMPKKLLQTALKEAVNQTFNQTSVDGDMSTNDTVLLFANGASGVCVSKTSDPLFLKFVNGLTEVCHTLSDLIVRDGEGATKVVRVNVQGAPTQKDAEHVARKIANCLLLKCALYGNTPNWGRVLSSIGATEINIPITSVSIKMQDIWLFRQGEPQFENVSICTPKMQSEEVKIDVMLGKGKGKFQMKFSDIGHEYVDINVS